MKKIIVNFFSITLIFSLLNNNAVFANTGTDNDNTDIDSNCDDNYVLKGNSPANGLLFCLQAPDIPIELIEDSIQITGMIINVSKETINIPSRFNATYLSIYPSNIKIFGDTASINSNDEIIKLAPSQIYSFKILFPRIKSSGIYKLSATKIPSETLKDKFMIYGQAFLNRMKLSLL